MAAVAPLAAARARLLQLKGEHATGRLDDQRYDEERRAIEREIGEGLLAGSDAASMRLSRPSRTLVAVLALFVVALAAVGYWQTGSPSLLRSAAPVAAAGDAADGAASGPSGLQQIEAMVGQLAERMKERPDDAEGWTMLARSYTVLGRFGEAIPAYARAAELQPTNATLLADYADAVGATKGTANNPQSIALIERALQASPTLPKALALAGSAAFDRGDYAVAIADWQKIVDQLPPGNELTPRVQAMIADARGKLGGGAAPASSAPAAAVAAATTAANPARPATGTSVSGTVTLDPALAAQAAPTDSVFVFARAASGSRMPLAVKRAQVKDLPLAFTLDDSMAMAPGMTLSSAPQLIVGARISKSGNAIAQPGDLAGEATGVAPGATNLAIRIGTVVGRP
ncbi:MAG TPA: c-type cytochrome biogenesis protein CcmI [Caldimonas sp.]|jgi:cytochrome c-type biogenesis protein CcmH|nr:c-type cytochrome biogenesis protein CcmI [Caldimonas sp.]HEV7577766.1 c-type cytochrome biogenesis protein CcmI [Caldimonas sp.]